MPAQLCRPVSPLALGCDAAARRALSWRPYGCPLVGFNCPIPERESVACVSARIIGESPVTASATMTFLNDLKFALRSLARAKGVAITVVVTLALGIGANAAIFSVVRGVLLRPLVNRDESRLIYIRQSARGSNVENTTFSVPEIQDLQAG